MIDFSINPQEAFEQAIDVGRLSSDKASPLYVGKWMYMGSSDGRSMFKSIETREYI